MTQILVENRVLVTLRVQMSVEGVGNSDILVVWPFVVVGVFADVANQQIEQSIVVIIEKECSRRMSHQSEPCFLGYVRKMPMPVVLEQYISTTNCRHE